MANKQYNPTQPEFYEQSEQFGTLSNLLGGQLRITNPEDAVAAFASAENFRAFVASRLPRKPSTANKLQSAFAIIPELKVPEKQQKERRELSEQARNAILDVAERKVFVDGGRKLNNRLDYVLLHRGNTPEITALNDEREQQLKGTAADRGRLLDERVRASVELYNRIINGEVSLQEMVNNFEQIHMVQDVVLNAQKFLAAATPNEETGEIYYEISDDTRKILQGMERHSNEVALFYDKMRIIANPNYEFMDLEYLLDVDPVRYEAFETYAQDESQNRAMDDVAFIIGQIKTYKTSIGRDNLMWQISDDFPTEFKNATLYFAGSDGEGKSMEFTHDHGINRIENFLQKGYVLVTTPSGDAACYYLDNVTGKVRSANANEMLSTVAPEMQDTLKLLKEANKGFFIGSREYSAALKGMEQATKAAKGIGVPPSPAKMEKVASQLLGVLQECEKYLEKKQTDPNDPDRDIEDILEDMSPREKKRYEAIQRTAINCRKQLSQLTLQRDAADAEKKAVMDFHRVNEAVPYPDVDKEVVGIKTYHTYAKEYSDWNNNMQTVNNEIPASNMGVIADDLRANIEKRLDTMCYECDPKEARNVMSDMVVLELVKLERKQDDQGNFVAGDIETKLAEDPGDTLTFFRNDPYIKAMTQNVTIEKLRNFIMNDGAKTMANRIMKVIEQSKAAALENKNAPDEVKEMANGKEKASAQDAVNAQNNQQEVQNEMQAPGLR